MDKDVLNSAIEAIQGLLKLVHMCEHEDTHRGGAIWEICDSCGAEWADDEGGRPEYEEPEEIENALIAIDLLKRAVDDREKEEWADAEAVCKERVLREHIVDKAARRAARMIWEDCLDRNSLKFVLRDMSSTTKYKEVLPAWVNIIKHEILGG